MRMPFIDPVSSKMILTESNRQLKYWVNAGLYSGYYKADLLPPLETKERTRATR